VRTNAVAWETMPPFFCDEDLLNLFEHLCARAFFSSFISVNLLELSACLVMISDRKNDNELKNNCVIAVTKCRLISQLWTLWGVLETAIRISNPATSSLLPRGAFRKEHACRSELLV
jgi:hypothetical protein